MNERLPLSSRLVSDAMGQGVTWLHCHVATLWSCDLQFAKAISSLSFHFLRVWVFRFLSSWLSLQFLNSIGFYQYKNISGWLAMQMRAAAVCTVISWDSHRWHHKATQMLRSGGWRNTDPDKLERNNLLQTLLRYLKTKKNDKNKQKYDKYN